MTHEPYGPVLFSKALVDFSWLKKTLKNNRMKNR
jgi:hypothetical protein